MSIFCNLLLIFFCNCFKDEAELNAHVTRLALSADAWPLPGYGHPEMWELREEIAKFHLRNSSKMAPHKGAYHYLLF